MNDKKDNYTPNEIPLQDRLKNLLISGFFIIYGGHGVWVNDLAIRLGKRRLGAKLHHFHDEAALVMYAGFIFVSLSFLSEVMDHYDRRNNEHIYHKISNYALWPGVVLCVLAFLIK